MHLWSRKNYHLRLEELIKNLASNNSALFPLTCQKYHPAEEDSNPCI